MLSGVPPFDFLYAYLAGDPGRRLDLPSPIGRYARRTVEAFKFGCKSTSTNSLTFCSSRSTS